ncbi:MAG TPA: hypothetical protein VGE74_20195, partial [Gemmata sp.]
MSSPETYCPACFADVAGDAARCPNPECAIAFIRCRNTSCVAPLAADAKFCADCGQAVEAPPPAPKAPPASTPPRAPEAASAVPTASAPEPAAALPRDLDALLGLLPTVAGAAPGLVPATAPLPVTTSAPTPALIPSAPVQSPIVGAAVVAVTMQAEYQTPAVIKKGQQAFLRVRALASGARDPLEVLVEYQSGLFTTAPVRATIAPVAITAFAPARFVPTVPGADTVHVTFTAKTSGGVPVGRWTGDVFLTVDDDAKQALQITNTGGGDVVMYGAPPVAPVNPLAGLPPAWKVLPLAPDPLFQRRAAGLRKPSAGAAPVGQPAPPGQALVVIEDRTNGTRSTVAMVRGSGATIGRGGNPGTSWWVQGEPLNKPAHLNISGLHLALELRDGYAWATDRSSRGSRLNGAPLPPKEASEAVALADGDEIHLADGFRIRVCLAADSGGAGAV